MKLTRHEIIRQLFRQGYFPGKFGFRAVIDMVLAFEAWQNRRFERAA